MLNFKEKYDEVLQLFKKYKLQNENDRRKGQLCTYDYMERFFIKIYGGKINSTRLLEEIKNHWKV
jgi:hypothetical protein